MVVYNTMELEDMHRLLPLEILEEIAIANTDELHTIVVVEQLASRLNAPLGAVKIGQRHALPPARGLHQPQTHGPSVAGGHIPGGGNRQRQWDETRPFFINRRTLDLAVCLPRYAPAWPPQVVPVLPPTMRVASGTGIFLPYTGPGHHYEPKNTMPSWNCDRAETLYIKQQCHEKRRRLRSNEVYNSMSR
jgi:hypothetical protein